MTKESTLIKRASYLSVIVAGLILLIKFYTWQTSNSQSLLASLVDSLLDMSTSIINLVAIRIILKPPDSNHRFGHGKFQDLAIFSQSMFFLASSIFTIISSTRALFLHKFAVNNNYVVKCMFFCMILTLILLAYQTYVIKKTKSKIISTDKLHYVGDFLTDIVVLTSAYLSSQFWWLDSLCGIAISLYIVFSSKKLFMYAVKNLVDEEMTDLDKKTILSIIEQHQEVKGVHDLKTRFAASKAFIQFHIEMDGNISLNAAHEVSEHIHNELLKVFVDSEILIHQDPVGKEEKIFHREEFRI